MNVTVVGGGYIGLVSALCFCEFGFNVLLIEKNKARFESLKKGIPTTSEVGVDSLLKKFIENNKLHFSDTIDENINESDAIIVAVATTKPDGPDSDLSILHDTIQEIALSLGKRKYTGIFIKTSVPIGTCSIIANNIRFMRPDLIPGEDYDVIANPGFLREGSAIHDFMTPNRAIIGFENENNQKAKELALNLYSALINMQVPIVFTNFESAELIRAATIAFISTKMAFINEMANLCDRSGADINAVIKGIALDQGIGYKSLQVSPGFGGTSFPRTIRILSNTADFLGVDLKVIQSVIESNNTRISSIGGRIINLINDKTLASKKACILGLSFKPLTGDIRESASIFVIRDLLENGVSVSAYDPFFQNNPDEKNKIPEDILKNKNFHIEESVYEAVSESSILVIMTNWAEFISLDFKKISELMTKRPGEKPVILDYRNMLSQNDLPDFEYISQGCN